jgi:hypothetical protein
MGRFGPVLPAVRVGCSRPHEEKPLAGERTRATEPTDRERSARHAAAPDTATSTGQAAAATAGNRAISRLIQYKLTVGPAGDHYEQEADRVAHQVMRGLAVSSAPPAARRQEEEEELQMSRVQRQEEEEELQMFRVQRQEEEEELQMSRVQRQEDEEELQMSRVQRQEEEEELQMSRVQRQEDEEELQMSPVQRQEEEEELQMSPDAVAPVVGLDGGGLDPGTEESIQRARGGGQALDGPVRAKMESAFGADFSGVRVHTGPEADALNRSMQAKAFTTGNDIFFRAGGYDPGSPAKQETLAHELTHVVQQRGGQPGVQRLSQDVKVAHSATKSFQAVEKVDDKGVSIRVAKVATGKVYKPGQSLKVDYDQRALSERQFQGSKADVANVAGEFARIDPYTDQFVRISGLEPPPTAPPPRQKRAGGVHKRAQELLDIGGSGAGLHDTQQSDEIAKLKGDIKSLPDGALKDAKKAEKTGLEDQRTDEALAASSLAGGGQLVALVASITALFNAKGKWKRAEAGMDVALQTAKTGATAADIVDKAGKQKYGSSAGFGGQAAGGAAEGVEKSTMAAGALGAMGEILAGVVAIVKRVKKIVDAVRKPQGLGGREKAHEALDTVKDAASVAKSAVSAAKSIIDVTQASGASDALANAVPGLGIAITAVDMIKRAFQLVVDVSNKKSTRDEKGTHKAELEGSGLQAALGIKKGSFRGKKMRRKDIKAKYDQIMAKDPAVRTPDEQRAIPIMENYLFAKELQAINDKRINRQSIGISLDANSIIADALNLGGVTAAAGLSMKIVGTATGLFVKGARRFKQWARDKAEKRLAKGQDLGFFGNFNAGKSTAAKAKVREDMINRMFQHLVEWQAMAETTEEERGEKAAQGERVGMFYKAAGMSWSAVQRYDDANALAEDLDEALKRRE